MENSIGVAAVNLTPSDIGQTKTTGMVNGVTPAASEPGISDVLVKTGMDFAGALQKAETTSVAGIMGEASAYEVATSVMEAEQALRMTVAVRDRIVQAYLEISRMQI